MTLLPLGEYFSSKAKISDFWKVTLQFLWNIPYIVNVVTWRWANIRTFNTEMSCFIDLCIRHFQCVTVSSPFTSDISSDNLAFLSRTWIDMLFIVTFHWCVLFWNMTCVRWGRNKRKRLHSKCVRRVNGPNCGVGLSSSFTSESFPSCNVCVCVCVCVYIYIYIQGVPGGMDKTSGECSLC